jgi:hypothetical protein
MDAETYIAKSLKLYYEKASAIARNIDRFVGDENRVLCLHACGSDLVKR